MPGPLFAISWAAIAFVLYKITAFVLDEIRHARNAKRLGCQQPPPLRTERWDFIGIMTISTMIKNFNKYMLPQFQKKMIEGAWEREGWRVTTFRNVGAL